MGIKKRKCGADRFIWSEVLENLVTDKQLLHTRNEYGAVHMVLTLIETR